MVGNTLRISPTLLRKQSCNSNKSLMKEGVEENNVTVAIVKTKQTWDPLQMANGRTVDAKVKSLPLSKKMMDLLLTSLKDKLSVRLKLR